MADLWTNVCDVFLSHSNADKPAIEDLARRLKREGIEPWLDKWNLVPGEPWQKPIEEALAPAPPAPYSSVPAALAHGRTRRCGPPSTAA